MEPAEQITDKLQLARTAYESGHLEEAFELIHECLAFQPVDGRALELLGLLEYSAECFQDSVSNLEAASMYVPLRPAGRVCLAHGYGRIGKRELSRDLLVELIRDESLPITLLLQVGTGLDYIGFPNLATEACREAIGRAPECSQAYYDLGYYIGCCGGSDETIECLARKAICLDPDNVRYRVGLAGLLWKHDRMQEAYEFVSQLKKEQIESITCACCLERVVDLYEHSKDYRRAVLCRQQLIAIDIDGHRSDCE
jgi:tetratricopeptide (TPR) repeat protein